MMYSSHISGPFLKGIDLKATWYDDDRGGGSSSRTLYNTPPQLQSEFSLDLKMSTEVCLFSQGFNLYHCENGKLTWRVWQILGDINTFFLTVVPTPKVIKCNRLETVIIKMARNSTLTGFNCCLSLYLRLTIDNRGLKRKGWFLTLALFKRPSSIWQRQITSLFWRF